jgi:hypothetical protein
LADLSGNHQYLNKIFKVFPFFLEPFKLQYICHDSELILSMSDLFWPLESVGVFVLSAVLSVLFG